MKSEKFKILLKWDFQTIQYYYIQSKNYYLELIKTHSDKSGFDEQGMLLEDQLAIGALSIFKWSVINELNTLVEKWILFCSTDEGIEFFNKEVLKQSRRKSIRLIESRYGITLEKLKGYSTINQIYNDWNGLKHRGGFLMPNFHKNGLLEIRTVLYNVEDLKEVIDDTQSFLSELISTVLTVKNR